MMQMMWRVPGHALALAYIVWAVAVSFLGSGHGQSGQDLTAALMILPFFPRTGASSPRPLYLTECLLIGPKENAA